MNAEVFSEWLRRQGHRVLCTPGAYWFDAGFRAYQAFPFHNLIQPDEQELSYLLRRHGALALRYFSPPGNGRGCPSYHVVYDGAAYSLDTLDRRTRQNVRKGLRQCSVTRIPMDRLAEEGWFLEADTQERQGRRATMSRTAWRRRYMAAADLPGFEAWGALVGDRLVASLLIVQIDDWCDFISQQCHHEFLGARVNNALAFTVTQEVMSRPWINSIFYTVESLDAPPSVDEFKFRMGYVARPVRQRIVFHPLVKPFANRKLKSVLSALVRRRPVCGTFGKAEGMLRFYFEEPSQEPPQHTAGTAMRAVESAAAPVKSGRKRL